MEPINSPITSSTSSLVVPVGKGTRFLNVLIDGILLGIVSNILGKVVGTVLPEPTLAGSLGFLVGLVIQYFYYSTQERNNGQTIGKRVTSTKAVMADGSPLTEEAVRARSLWRLIPLFDALSFLFGQVGWHDKYSNTRVVSSK